MRASSHTPRAAGKRVAVVGGGIIGLGIAWEAIQRGHHVTVFDPAPASGATYAAAGMLAPVSELHYQEEHLLTLTVESARRYPELMSRLETDGRTTGYRRTQTIAVGADAADRRALDDLKQAQVGQGLAVEDMTTRQARAEEPMLGPGLSAAFRIPGDRQVDPRLLSGVLLDDVRAGGMLEAHSVESLAYDDGNQTRVAGVVLADGTRVEADETVIANGLQSPEIKDLPATLSLPVRPVYGDVLRLRVPRHLQPLLTATVRGVIRGRAVYLVPRQDGSVVVGATQREGGTTGVSAGGVYELLRDAQMIVPAVAELEFEEATCRARPGTPDNAPLLGRPRDVGGLICATGFFRHGVLLMPVTAAICNDLIDGGPADPKYRAFLPDRFQGETA